MIFLVLNIFVFWEEQPIYYHVCSSSSLIIFLAYEFLSVLPSSSDACPSFTFDLSVFVFSMDSAQIVLCLFFHTDNAFLLIGEFVLLIFIDIVYYW